MHLTRNILLYATVAGGAAFLTLAVASMLVSVLEVVGSAPAVSNMGQRIISSVPFLSLCAAGVGAFVAVAKYTWLRVLEYQREKEG